MKHPSGEVAANRAVLPVVAPGNRPRRPPQVRGKGRPDQDEIEVTRVVAEVDSRPSSPRIAVPHDRGAAHQARREGEGSPNHRASTSVTNRAVRRQAVAMDPAVTTA